MRVWTLAVLVAAGCTAPVRGSVCSVPERTGALPAELRESSGVAISRTHPGVLWTHNDSGEPLLFAIDATGRILARVRVRAAAMRDWEDIELGACPEGQCLYIGDIGDNAEVRDHIIIYRVPEPAPADSVTAHALRLIARYPDRPQDAEALFLLPTGLHLITKGRNGSIALYRVPDPGTTDSVLVLEKLQDLSTGAALLPNQVTGAAATPDGSWVAVRTYASLQLYRVHADTLASALAEPAIDLQPLQERQGESVAISQTGLLVLTSEAGNETEPAVISRIRCKLP